LKVDIDISKEYTASICRVEVQELALFYGQVTKKVVLSPKED
jgi:hypothetical protein